jgi:hypothetical protein
VIGGNCVTSAFSAIVSQTKISGIQAIVTISQATATAVFTFASPSLVKISEIFHFLCTQALFVIVTSCHTFTFHS